MADLRTAFLDGTLDFGVAKVHLAFGDTKVDTAHNWLVGPSALVGASTVLASCIRSDTRIITDGASDQYALGYICPLSKRANLYTPYGYSRTTARYA